MSDNNTTYYHNFTGRIVPPGGLTDDATTGIIRSETTMSPKGVLKSTRRRSRVSKKTPTTHLSANTSNFRALVQQFTGCPRPPFSHGSQKGPINLSFGHRAHDEDNSLMAPPSKYSHYTQQSDQPPQQQQQLQQQEWCHQDQQQGLLAYHDQQYCDMLSSDNVTSDVFFSNITAGNPRSNMEFHDNFVAVNNGNMNSTGYYL